MAEKLVHKIKAGRPVHLAHYPTDATGGLDKGTGQQQLAPLLAELHELQQLMWGAQTHALLVVLQGRDASGKDGIINHVFSSVNPQGLQVTAFKAPTATEAAHDFLWRVHAAAPAKGLIGVYNRSHYEQVLVVRVHQLAPPAAIAAAYDQITAYEQLLVQTGTIVVKCYLHLSPDEQRRRLLAREQDLSKAWKLNPDDWAERQHWDDFTAAYEDALSRCSPAHAPWYVIPADHKWAAHLAIAQIVVDALRPHRPGWTDALAALQQERLAALQPIAKK
ncbi:MAG TPA: PPK2 family polyphosphate kinase [Chloroflexia bacterium]|nr:PPK2 family polyphosphate kinase [Chloroflexia bacterium]